MIAKRNKEPQRLRSQLRRRNVLITFCVIALLYCLAGRALPGRISESIRLILAIASLSYLPSKYLALAWTSLENGTDSLLVRLLFSERA